jgi:cyclin H
MVAAAFLGSKIEDATTDVRYLEEGTQRMQAPVTTPEIITAELVLATGIHFNFLCFHPYKAVLALTEDLRTFLKSEKGKTLAHFSNQQDRTIVGQDLKPMHDAARKLIDDVIVSDIPLLYSPGQVGLAALIVANDELRQQGGSDQLQQQQQNTDSSRDIPEIDLRGYIRHRFEDHPERNDIEEVVDNLCDMLKGLRHGQYHCANHQVDMTLLKSVHKKLKKCRAWGKESSTSSGKKKKRKGRDDDDGNDTNQDVEHDAKRGKTTE